MDKNYMSESKLFDYPITNVIYSSKGNNLLKSSFKTLYLCNNNGYISLMN